ncbi:hypothetical protein, partial [Ilumatobacter nonamiensis]|uniref:hypothetical protein n=1 Tax=Ilumatobacter nonamiensis TaxID=467093 RepID=UPI00059163F8
MAERRAVALTITESATPIEREAIFDALEIPSRGARRTALHRARRLLESDPLIVDLAARVCQLHLDDLGCGSADRRMTKRYVTGQTRH